MQSFYESAAVWTNLRGKSIIFENLQWKRIPVKLQLCAERETIHSKLFPPLSQKRQKGGKKEKHNNMMIGWVQPTS